MKRLPIVLAIAALLVVGLVLGLLLTRGGQKRALTVPTHPRVQTAPNAVSPSAPKPKAPKQTKLHQAQTPTVRTLSTTTTATTAKTKAPPPLTLSPAQIKAAQAKANGYGKPFRPGNPQAADFGQAFQVLDKAHRPQNASSVYWLGPSYNSQYPYVRAMKGSGAEFVEAAVEYGPYQTADAPKLLIETYDTRPQKLPPPPTGGPAVVGKKPPQTIPTQGSLLVQSIKGLKAHSAPLGPYVLTPQGWAVVSVAPHTLVKVTVLDGSIGTLPDLLKALKPYPQG